MKYIFYNLKEATHLISKSHFLCRCDAILFSPLSFKILMCTSDLFLNLSVDHNETFVYIGVDSINDDLVAKLLRFIHNLLYLYLPTIFDICINDNKPKKRLEISHSTAAFITFFNYSIAIYCVFSFSFNAKSHAFCAYIFMYLFIYFAYALFRVQI